MSGQQFLNKKAQQRTALLALAGHRRESSGTCLSPEDMANLVDGNCSTAEQQTAMDHLAGCERCYREWLTLQAVRGKPSSGHRVVRFFSRPRNLAAFGSLLAAAASVVLFLNIRYPSSPTALQEQAAEPVFRLEQDRARELTEDKEDAALPAGLPDALEKAEYEASQLPAQELGSGSLPPAAKPALPKQTAPLPMRQQAVAPQAEEAEVHRAGKTLPPIVELSFADWQQEVVDGCRRKESAPEYWAARQREGELLLTGPLTDSDRARVRDILSILAAGPDSTGVSTPCPALAALLEKKPDRGQGQ